MVDVINPNSIWHIKEIVTPDGQVYKGQEITKDLLIQLEVYKDKYYDNV